LPAESDASRFSNPEQCLYGAPLISPQASRIGAPVCRGFKKLAQLNFWS